jgi:putative ABC transport system permease protein
MWKNYLVASFRSLVRNKRFASLNILGLAVGLAATLLMAAYVVHELSFDRSHVRGERIYRINGNVPYGDRVLRNAVVAGPLGPAVKESVPEVEDSVRLLRLNDVPVKVEGREFKERKAFAAEPSVFEVFTVPFRSGDPKTALSAPFTVVLEESLGRKYFGDVDPVGRTLQLRIGENHDFLVTGVIRDLPSNTVLKRPLFVSFATYERLRGEGLTRWENWGSVTTFALLRPGADPEAVAAKITATAAPHLDEKGDGKTTTYALQPLHDVYLHTMNNDLDTSGSAGRVTVFAIIAGLMLLIAAINFINLSTAKVAGRMKEVGVRKACGAGRTSLVRQFLVESTLLAAVSMAIAIALAELFKPSLEAYLGKALTLGLWTAPGLLAAAALTIVVGLLAGSYPAFYLSRFPATAMFRPGASARTSKSGLRRVLVVSQFAIAITLMAATAVVIKQIRFAETKDLGFDQARLVVIKNESAYERKNASLLKREMLARTAALSAASIDWLPSSQNRNISRFSVEGRAEDRPLTAQTLGFDADFISTMGLRLVAGRNFEADRPPDPNGVLINEEAVRAFKLEEPVGSRLRTGDETVEVIGVLRDWHTNSIHSEIYPVVVYPSGEDAFELVLRLPAGRTAETIQEIRIAWSALMPGQTLDLEFVDELLARAYVEDRRLAVLLVSFCGLTIFVACLGIFGLASFSAEQRTKEIGVRKVLGASVPGLVVLLAKSFSRWVLWANLFAWPAAYLAARKWLAGFAYRTPLGPAPFVLAGLLALVIAFVSVLVQTVRAAAAQPIDSLRYE